jgi:hypothetical protein
MARFALRTEGDRIVLRDHANLGPRATAARKAVIGVVLLVLSAALWWRVALVFQAGSSSLAIGLSAAAALVSLTGYAFVGVARHSARYVARSRPLLWIGKDRLVVAPWVSRTGAVDRLAEVRGRDMKRRGGRTAIEVDTEHGPMDALVTDREDVAQVFMAALRRMLAETGHPSARMSAKRRLRARARGPVPSGAAG